MVKHTIIVYFLVTLLPFLTKTARNLEYEYLLIFNVLLVILLPINAIYFYSDKNKSTYDRFFFPLIVAPLIILLILNTILRSSLCSCSVNGFNFWFIVQTIPTWIVVHAIYYYLLKKRSYGVNKFRLTTLYLSALTIMIGLELALIWITPQKRTINILLGFIHGPIYDHYIAIDAGIVLARLAHFTLGLTAVVVLVLKNIKHFYKLVFALIITYTVLIYFSSTYASTYQSEIKLKSLFKNSLSTSDFKLYYNKDKHSQNQVNHLFLEAKFHIRELKKIMGNDSAKHVDIYVYSNKKQKKLWFGAGSTDVADVYNPSIHITLTSFIHPSLRHELVHALSSSFAFHGLGFHPNISFVEGLAEALAPRAGNMNLNERAAILFHKNKNLRIQDIFSPFFWLESSAKSYTLSGSFISYLIEKYGFAKVKNLYSGAEFNYIFNTNIDTEAQLWKKHISKNFLNIKNTLQAESLFRFPGVFYANCPHSKEDLYKDKSEIYNILRQPIQWDRNNYFKWRTEIDPSDINSRISLWKQEVKKSITKKTIDNIKVNNILDDISKKINTPIKNLEDIEMKLLTLDINLLKLTKNNLIKIKQKTLSLFESTASHNLPDYLKRKIQIRKHLLESTDPLKYITVLHYLSGFKKIPQNILQVSPNSWILKYLFLRSNSFKASKEILSQYLNIRPNTRYSKNFHFEWYRIITIKAYRLNLFGLAYTALERAINVKKGTQSLLYKQHKRLIQSLQFKSL